LLSRRHVPLNALRAFEAAGRHMSFTIAAEELNVTQVAVSRQVRVLEEYLEIPLFVRGHRSLTLTEDGEHLLASISRALEDVEHAVSAVSLRGRRDVLAIQAYTTFAQKWLIPRLRRFHEQNARIEVRLSTSIQPVNFDRQNIHAAIRSGKGEFDGCDSNLIVPIELVPVCSPKLLQDGKIKTPDDLSRQTLLHSLARRNDWRSWLTAAGVRSVDSERGLKFENSALSYEAALQGIGIAIGMRVLVEPYLRQGALVCPFPNICPLDEGYYLVRPKNRPVTPALRAFQDWLRQETKLASSEPAFLPDSRAAALSGLPRAR
jgi:LysR family transcriptional regulator, glycine cleavage system transcriptional activator